MNTEILLAETLKILELNEVAGQTINGYRIENDFIVSPNNTKTRLTKTKPFQFLKWMNDSQKQNFRRVMRNIGKAEMSGFNDLSRELFVVANGSLLMIKFEESEKGKSIRQLIYKPVVNHGFHSTFSFKRITR
ncbi:hypothetical protein [Vibrio parahaemolyticus]|uniref:hypothetical protein n=1 Tax=Vibrio parahaemolyticus TaxID=670 RepID=UPI00111D30AD|nr:hypothetical protein [Vibrio parahaemolyticus]TOM96829.1 hypothetical protein CGH65_20755 [Vibrio parahaemolyticus]